VETLTGTHIRLEPLEHRHIDGLTAASAASSPELYKWSPVPLGTAEVTAYVEKALAGKASGDGEPFATIRIADNNIIGCTRFWNIERWAWPPAAARHGITTPDACEIGWTWLTESTIRTVANTEAKFLMLTYAFETWKMLRVCLHTDVRNARSRAAIERIGGKFEGILRAHRIAADLIPRDSARFSIIAAEWPELKQRLSKLAMGREASHTKPSDEGK
jgi:RimJ/RimL family protein N-acetyltransferase